MTLTRGQLRRRFFISLLTLITALPLPVVFLGFLTIGGNKLFIRGGKLVNGTCADCCSGGGGGGCGSCISGSACPFCLGDTPTTWHVTFHSVETNLTCQICGVGAESAGTGSLGTYTLTQDGGDACLWTTTASSPTILNDRTTGDCSTVDDTFSSVNIDWRQTNTGRFACFAYITGTGAVSDPFFFNGDVVSADCCASQTISNNLVVYACDSFGINGTAVGTPC